VAKKARPLESKTGFIVYEVADAERLFQRDVPPMLSFAPEDVTCDPF